MSLARIALRTAAVEAIKGRTLVGDNVLDSPNGALDIQADGTLRTDEDRPFVAVYTDIATAGDVTGRDLTENGSCVLVIEIGISMAMTELDRETGRSTIVGVSVPASDRAFEFFLEIVQKQVLDALTDPDSDWADIFRALHSHVEKIEVGTRRTSDNGQKLAGHQTRITMALFPDPARGAPLDGRAPLARFLAALEAENDPTYEAQAQAMRSVIGGAVPDWKQVQIRHGLTRAELRALGSGPIISDESRVTPPLKGASVAIEGVGQREVP
ncbi:hypothetical protein NS226_13855 [Aureimonas ureilytica]|uniref:Uncharacterized protein n=1 Tax=Aureimonas ureilytica TaxID=401562 RepID=A0A175R8Y3_9HYPH|nr:hypothetical protein [Aureimonas ureilytica]KTQ95011.1 hypothetical protein NS226_13855 [Aureimonas ureilytica]